VNYKPFVCILIKPICLQISPIAPGGFVGLSPHKTKLQAPPNENMKHYKSVKFMSNFGMSCHLHKHKAPLLKTFWQRFYFKYRCQSA